MSIALSWPREGHVLLFASKMICAKPKSSQRYDIAPTAMRSGVEESGHLRKRGRREKAGHRL